LFVPQISTKKTSSSSFLHYGENFSKPEVPKIVKYFFCNIECTSLVRFRLSGIYTGEKTLHVVTIASCGDLKKMGEVLLKSHCSQDPHRVCE
jgi:hypothetical protein